MDALLTAYEHFKTAASPTLASYARALPALPNELEASGSYPQARDLWDGVAIALLLTLARILLTALVLDHVGRTCMKHRYYRIKRQAVPVIDAALRCAWVLAVYLQYGGALLARTQMRTDT